MMAKVDEKPKVFEALKKKLTPYQKKLAVVTDSEKNFYLDTTHIQKNKKPLFFGAVQMKKSYVSYHLMPVYVAPELLDDVSDELKSHMQGKSCFNLKTNDKDLIKELGDLTKAGYKYYSKQGYV